MMPIRNTMVLALSFRVVFTQLHAVFRIRIHIFLGLPDPDLLVRGIDPDPSTILLSSCKNSKKKLDSYCFVTSFGLFTLKNDVNVPSKSNEQKNFFSN
jgi:hypothetical protein